MPFLSHAGVELRYDRAGSGPPVLLVHGWIANRTYWDAQVQALRDRHTVITVDLRGHGESSRPRTGYSLGALVGDLEHLVRALGVPRLGLVGWSLGGLLAMELARRLGDRVTALGLVSTTPGGLTAGDNPLAQPERAREFAAQIEKDFRAFARGFVTDEFRLGEKSPFYAWALAQSQKTPPHAALACFETIITADLRPLLPKLKVKTAVFHGRHDTLLPLAGGEVLAKKIPGATLTVFEESGHAPFLEEAEAFNRALAELLAPAVSPPAGRSGPSAPSGRGRSRTSR